ncbi:hypothetical protein LIER_17939 [Lithospermum erythrorhizon]|uniref:Zinc-ribbon domain-containing protein n=1 Tax=Lithospermum erythrorhizon TaxID=34254 RepID=A0AAV3QES9_LITER
MSTAIRLVRCPKCRKILPELPNIPVYKCGGCGKILQAKEHKNSIKGNESRVHETDPILKYEASSNLRRLSKHGDRPSIESSPGSDAKREQLESGSPDSEKPVDRNLSDEKCHSTEPTYLKGDKFSLETNESSVQGEHECMSDRDVGLRNSESLDHHSENPDERTSDKLSDSCGCQENEDSSTEIRSSGRKYEEGYSPKLTIMTSVNEIEDSQGVLEDEKKFSGEPKNLDDPETTRSSESEAKLVVTEQQQNVGNEIGKYTNDTEDFQGELSLEGNHSNEPQSSVESATHFSVNEPLKWDEEYQPSSEDEEHSQMDVRKYILRDNDWMRQNKFANKIVEYSQKREITKETSSISTNDFQEAETSILTEKNCSVVDGNSRSHIVKYGPEAEEEITAARGPLIRSMVFAPLSTDEMYLKESPEVSPSFHRINSEEMLDTLPINPRVPIASLPPDDINLAESHEVGSIFHRISSEEMLDTLPINPRVPIGSMSKSPTKTYYAGDESESSYDGQEELSAQVSHLYSRKFKGTGTTSTKRSRQKDGFRVKNKHNGQHWRHHESPEPRKQNHPIRTSLTATNNDPVSSGSYMLPRISQLFHRNGSPESSTENVFLHSGEFRGPDKMLDSDPEKVELLRMVHELEDKINSIHMSKQMSDEQLPLRDVGEDIHTGGYYDDPTMGRNPYVDFKYSGHQRSHTQGVGRANEPRSSRLAFLGEASQCKNHIDCRCSHCYHQSFHVSPKLSSHCIHCQHEAHPRHDYDNMYPYYSPSPLHTSSEFSHEIQADDQKYDHEMRIYFREKDQVMKRHLRPVSGGAPIISCYHCSELLQLSADFLLFRRRCHQIRCNSCNRILKFLLLKKLHLVPYVIKIKAHPSSEMDDYINIVDSRTLALTSH